MKTLITLLSTLCVLWFNTLYSQDKPKTSSKDLLIQKNTQIQLTKDTLYGSRDGLFFAGILTTTTKYPERFQVGDNPKQTGFIIGSPSHTSVIEEIKTSKFGKISLNIGADFSVGFAMGSNVLKYKNLPTINPDTTYLVKHYTGTADLFSLNINAEYIAYLPEKRSFTAGIAVTFFNVGGAITYMDGGVFDKNVFAIINTIPLYIEPYAVIKLKEASLGIGLFLNPFSFLEFRIGPKIKLGEQEVTFFDYGSGINFSVTQISKYALLFYIKF